MRRTVYKVRASVIRRFQAFKPVAARVVVPSVQAADGDSWTDEVIVEKGQWVEIIRPGAPDRWSVAVIRG